LKIALQAETASAKVIRQLLSPWDVSFASVDEADITITYKKKLIEGTKSIIIPTTSADFAKSVRDLKLDVSQEIGRSVSVAAGSQTSLVIIPSRRYHYSQLGHSCEDTTSTCVELDRSLIFLTVDVVHEYNLILNKTLSAKPSTTYRLLTNSPVPYVLAPKQLKDILMRQNHNQEENLRFPEKLSMDALRFTLVEAIEKSLAKKLAKKTWDGKTHAYVLTHDIDTQLGMQNARHMMKLEEKYDICSAWYIPSKHYNLDQDIVRDLSNHGEVGSHDTKHDGKLAYLPRQKLVERLVESKKMLAKIVGKPVEGFRAPLLQHSISIIEALVEAGYTYDTSIPTWEPKHPYTMKPHGIGTVHPLLLEDLVEIPITLPQDHQLLTILGLTPRVSLTKWLGMINVVKDMGGLCTLLVHPDYEMANLGSNVYEELLERISVDDQGTVLLPSEVALQQAEGIIQAGALS
jgi:peptidoglycan/xylan/chitin deacetylase (PgdA/CDA1 family)